MLNLFLGVLKFRIIFAIFVIVGLFSTIQEAKPVILYAPYGWSGPGGATHASGANQGYTISYGSGTWPNGDPVITKVTVYCAGSTSQCWSISGNYLDVDPIRPGPGSIQPYDINAN